MKKLLSQTLLLSLLSSSVFAGGNKEVVCSTSPIMPIETPLYYSLGLKAGTLGLGVDFAIPLNRSFSVRLNLNGASLTVPYTKEEIEYDLNLDLLTAGVMLDYYPFSKSALRLSAGAYYYANTSDGKGTPTAERYDIGDRTYTKAQMGNATGSISFQDFAPYVGVGYGGKSTSKGWGFAMDIGVMYHGDASLDMTLVNGTLDTTIHALFASDVEKERQKIENDINNFPFYPVVMMGITYNF